MGRFIYHIPAREVRPETFAFPHPPDLIGGGTALVENSPSGHRGCIFCLRNGVFDGSPHPPDLVFRPEVQTWAKFGQYWIGWITDDPPTPNDLKHRAKPAGHAVKFLDGHEWVVGVARSFSWAGGANTLPTVFGADEDGNPCRRPHPQHRVLFEYAERGWRTMFNRPAPGADPESMLTFDELLEATALALGLNYRITVDELRVRAMADENVLTEAIRALTDYPRWREAGRVLTEQKKTGKSPSGTNTDSTILPGGHEESGHPDTPRQSPS